MKVIGLTGTIACGKEKVKELIVRKFDSYQVSLSGAIRGEMERRSRDFSRKTLQDMGNELRQKYGTHILAKVSTEFMPRAKPVMVVDGIRNPGEAEYLRKTYKGDFILVAVDAPQELRFERVQKRNRPLDPKTWEEFVALDERDQGKDEPQYGQQVKKCIGMADIKIENDGDEAKLNAKLEELFLKI